MATSPHTKCGLLRPGCLSKSQLWGWAQVLAARQDSEDALNSGWEDALLRPLQAGLLGLRRRPRRKISARSRELLLPRGLWSKAKLELEGRRDERVELEETDELCQGVTALTLGRQM